MSRGLFLNFLFHFIGVTALLLYYTVLVRNPPAMQETWVRALGWEDPLEKGRVPTPVFWLGEFHGPYSLWCHQESDTHEQLSLSLSYCFKYHSFIIWLEIRKCNAFSFVLLSQNFFFFFFFFLLFRGLSFSHIHFMIIFYFYKTYLQTFGKDCIDSKHGFG